MTEDDLVTFLGLAGFVESAGNAPSLANWDRWPTHRMALSWQGEKLDHPKRSEVLLTKGTRTADLGKRVADVLAERLPNASVVELMGDHAHHIESIDAFLGALEANLRGPYWSRCG